MPARLYNWEIWFAPGSKIIRRGEDYAVPQSTMANQIRSAASIYRVTVHLQDLGYGFRIAVERKHATR